MTDDTADREPLPAVSRRRLGALAGLSAAGLPLLAACGGGDSSAPGNGAAAGTELGTTAEIPVGGGKVFLTHHVVVTQPEEGTFKGFSSFCTHQSCQVSKVEGGTIVCPCHGSTYSIVDGSVQGGPAPKALPEVRLAVKGGEVRLG